MFYEKKVSFSVQCIPESNLWKIWFVFENSYLGSGSFSSLVRTRFHMQGLSRNKFVDFVQMTFAYAKIRLRKVIEHNFGFFSFWKDFLQQIFRPNCRILSENTF